MKQLFVAAMASAILAACADVTPRAAAPAGGTAPATGPVAAGSTSGVLPTPVSKAGSPKAFSVREDFLKLIDRPRVALAPVVKEMPIATAGLAEYHFTFASEAGQTVPGILIESTVSTGHRPVVIAMHGTGGKKEDEVPFLTQLAQRGFVAVAIDGRYHGERATGAPKQPGLNAYETAIVRSYHDQKEHALFYDTVWDIMRLVDYLQTRDDVDGARVGLFGISKGGIETYLAAAVDPRIGVAVPCIGVQSFQWELANNDWKGRIGTFQKAFDAIAKEQNVPAPDSAFVQAFYDKALPGVYGEFDGPSIVPLIAPRPLLMINSDKDDHTPLPSVQLTAAKITEAYHEARVDDHYVLRIQANTGHTVLPASQRAALEWFAQWLKP